MSAYVYLLAHQSAARFKIGKANDVGARVRQLGPKRFDMSKSRALRVCDDVAAMNLERLLHRAFAKSRIAPTDVIGLPGESTDGDSEWFAADCKGRLDEFLDTNRDLLDFEPVSDQDFASMLPAPRKPVMAAQSTKSLGRPRIKPPEPKCDPVDVARDVEAFLGKLSSFVARASNLGFEPPKERWDYGVLSGALSVIGEFDPQPLFDELMDCSIRTGRWGAFRLVSSVRFVKEATGVSFELDVLWDSHRDQFEPHSQAAAQIAAYPLPVEGWNARLPARTLN